MKKRIIILICSILIVILLLGALQALVVPKYTDNTEGLLIREYYENVGDNDVIFVGDCEVYESFVPAVLYEKYGITSYIRGSAQQLVWQSYYLLEETFKREMPKAVVFNVYALKYGTPQDEAYNRMTLDGMKWSASKYRAIRASMTEEENMLDYAVPLLRFHSRITELEADDFKYMFSDKRVSHSGYLMKKGVVPMTEEAESGRALLDYTLPETAMEYLDKMRELCEKHGTELILVKAPTNTWGFWWYDEWDAQVTAYAEKNDLSYYNFIDHKDEIGIDFSTDTYDEGMHLNVYGAEKLTDYFGRILSEDHGLNKTDRSQSVLDRWQANIDAYYKERNS